MKTYFVKLTSGYYYAVENGQYGRFGRALAWSVRSAQRWLIKSLTLSVLDEKPSVEESDAVRCAVCKKLARSSLRAPDHRRRG